MSKLVCPFCQGPVSIDDGPNDSNGMLILDDYDGDLEFFDGPVKILQCVKDTNHYVYITEDTVKTLVND